MSRRVRYTALALAVLMLCGTLVSLMGMIASAAPGQFSDFYIKSPSSGREINKLSYGTEATVQFWYVDTIPGVVEGTTYTASSFTVSDPWYRSGSSTRVRLLIGDPLGADKYNIQVTIENIVYKRTTQHTNFTLKINDLEQGGVSVPYSAALETNIPSSYFESGSSNWDDDDDENPYKSDIVVENIYFTDASGERINKVDKDTTTFNLVIIYADYGLREVDTDQFDERSLDVYLTEVGGFSTSSGTKGTLTYLKDTSADAPRFRAAFRGITYEGGGNTVSFRAMYDIFGWDVSGTGSAVANNAKEEDDDDKLSPLTPHIIVNQYSYGTDQINAGNNFTLNLSVTNTSPDIPLENIVMTIQPYIPENNTSSTTGGLTITSASNTLYIPALGVGQSYSHSIDLRAEPSAAVGSHKVEVEFSFQYVDAVNKKRESSTDKESIAIPVSQVDRFSVDPLTELPEWLNVGESDYITLSFVNKGKSTTYNISGTLTTNTQTVPQSVHFGNLEAGASDTMDFEIFATEPGEMTGEIILQYEDENANILDIPIPFTIPVIDVWDPSMDDPWGPGGMDIGEEDAGELKTATVVLCVIGSLLFAAPIALYLFKRVKAKGIEDFDEDI